MPQRWIPAVVVVAADGDAAVAADKAATEVAEMASEQVCTTSGMARHFTMGWVYLTLVAPSLDLRRWNLTERPGITSETGCQRGATTRGQITNNRGRGHGGRFGRVGGRGHGGCGDNDDCSVNAAGKNAKEDNQPDEQQAAAARTGLGNKGGRIGARMGRGLYNN